MFSERVRGWLADVRSNVEDINRYIGDVDEAGFAGDKLLRDAVERCLERISEAVARIDRSGCNLEALEPTIPWRDIRGIGNRLRHACETIDPNLIWQTIQGDLGPLLEATHRLLAP